jgi:hypothetical protein
MTRIVAGQNFHRRLRVPRISNGFARAAGDVHLVTLTADACPALQLILCIYTAGILCRLKTATPSRRTRYNPVHQC